MHITYCLTPLPSLLTAFLLFCLLDSFFFFLFCDWPSVVIEALMKVCVCVMGVLVAGARATYQWLCRWSKWYQLHWQSWTASSGKGYVSWDPPPSMMKCCRAQSRVGLMWVDRSCRVFMTVVTMSYLKTAPDRAYSVLHLLILSFPLLCYTFWGWEGLI